ncbi:MAG: hypothetical protein JKX68_03425 [Flavobacteriales bacterium]|nr:hypothetical protein [Flavobacteriales bacterium]
MKKIIASTSILILLSFIISCGGLGSYYEQFTKDKAFTSRISDLNKTIDEIRAIEKGKLIRDDINLLKYVYEIGNNDTYQITYQFDEKGCWEVGIDCYFENEEDAKSLVLGIKSEITTTVYGSPTEDNNLYRWENANEPASIEIDYKDTSRGIVVLTIMAVK